MKRLKVAKWFDDAGHSIGLWIAPEKAEIDDIMTSESGTPDGEVMLRLREFAKGTE